MSGKTLTVKHGFVQSRGRSETPSAFTGLGDGGGEFQNKNCGGIVKNKAVLVTTEFRGVFFGFVKDDKKLPAEITLTKAKNCLYWSSDCQGFLGLAAGGPTSGCKIGVEVPELTLYKITSVTPVSDKAVEAWTR
jgi:hypothetical protein